MITAWDIYWITRLDMVGDMFFLFSFIGAFAVLGVFMYNNMALEIEGADLFTSCKKCVRIYIVGATILCLATIILPSTKEFVAIYAIPAIVNNEDVQEIPQNTAKFINDKLKEWMDEVGNEAE